MRSLWQRFMVLGLSLLLASGMFLVFRLALQSTSTAQASAPAVAPLERLAFRFEPPFSVTQVNSMSSAPVVLAEYHVWHGLPNHLIPPPYTSTEPSVISTHIRLAQAQDIGGFVVDWYGKPSKPCGTPGGFINDCDREFMDQATAELMQQAGPRGFRVALMYDEGTISWTGITNTISYTNLLLNDLLYAKQYLTMTAYLTMTTGITTAPVIFVFPYDTIDPYIDWSYIRSQLGIPVILLDKDPNPSDPTHDANFDGFYAWVWTPEWKADGTKWGEDYLIWFYETMKNVYSNKITVGGVWPGFDDSLASWGSNRYIWRRCGQTWLDTWELANTYNPPFVMIGTWNDIEEGTDIEYGVGDCLAFSQMSLLPGQVIYTDTLINTGKYTDTFNITVQSQSASPITTSFTSKLLPPHASTALVITVTVPITQVSTGSSLTVTATSTLNSSVKSSLANMLYHVYLLFPK
jgi:hypothetical protein